MRCFCVIASFLLTISAFTQDKGIPRFIKTKGFENATIGICVKDKNGKILHQHNRSRSLTPASVLKLVTSATALEMLGSEYKVKTELLFDTDNNTLLVKGFGDPTLGSEFIEQHPGNFLNEWVRQFKQVTKAENNIRLIVDDSYFGYNGLSNKWIREDMGNYYAAGAYGISVFDNTYKLFLSTASGEPEIIKTEPEISIEFTNELTLNKSGNDNGFILGEPFSNKRLLTGDIPANRKFFVLKGDIPDPGMYLGLSLQRSLQDSGIHVSSVTTNRLYKSDNISGHLFYTHYSPALKDILKIVNHRSNNHYSEHLIRLLGKRGNNALASGINKLKSFWKSKGLDCDALFMYDGCGLASSNAVSPEFICDILLYMQDKSKYSEDYFSSLPKAGKEGTVKNFLKGTKLEGKIHVKSGSIANVQCYAGYYIRGSEKHTFSIMVNNYTCSRREVIKAIENLLLDI